MNRKNVFIPLLWILFMWYSLLGSASAETTENAFVFSSETTLQNDPIIAIVSNATVYPGTEFCVDISVSSFSNISTFQFSMGWGDAKLQYQSIHQLGDPSALNLLVGETLTDLGVLTIMGTAPDGMGMTFPDETTLFQLCFTVIGAIDDCTAVAFTGFPLGIEVTQVETGTVDIGMENTNGVVCIVPPLLINNSQTFDVDCSNLGQGVVQLSVNGARPPYTYQWDGPDGFVGNTKNIFGLNPGDYKVTISDASNPPATADSVFTVLGDVVYPIVELAGDTILNCFQPNLILSTQIENIATDPSFVWTTVDGNFVSGQNSLHPIIDQSGTYQIIVSNPSNACQDTGLIVITENIIKPLAVTKSMETLNCQVTELTLNAAGSSIGDQLKYQWFTENGTVVSGINSLMPVVEEAGDYSLVIQDTINGCSDTSEVVVLQNIIQPIANAGAAKALNCSSTILTLDGMATSENTSLDFLWTTMDGQIIDGEKSLTPNINSAGIYNLMVVDTVSFCKDSAAVVITIDTIAPQISIELEGVLSCINTSVLLDGSNSSSGPDIDYQWSTIDGQINGSESATNVEVDQVGTYQLVLQNNSNQCRDSFSVEVITDNSDLAIQLEALQLACNQEAMIIANLPEGTTGRWESLGSAVILESDEPVTEVENLIEGNNLLTWTLSTSTCPDYDQDTLIVRVETLPIAQDDVFKLGPLPISEPLVLVANDGINVTDNWVLELLSMPAEGSVESLERGVVEFLNPNNFTGSLDFSYQLCNTVCPNLCDEAKVLLEIRKELLVDSTVLIPSGITPNDDGRNDTFVISFLEEDLNAYPGNSLTIFNRWGDVVYLAKPYLNDWDGRAQTGKNLPQGTYYYVLRLSLLNGQIYQGDITILR